MTILQKTAAGAFAVLVAVTVPQHQSSQASPPPPVAIAPGGQQGARPNPSPIQSTQKVLVAQAKVIAVLSQQVLDLDQRVRTLEHID